MGGQHPIRIQSMTTTDTMDTMRTVEQIMRLAALGCDYVRVTTPSIKEAKNLALIKAELKKRGYVVPLIADVHFTPHAAEEAARIVEKVRINPGNYYVDKKQGQYQHYSPTSYQEVLERITQKLLPLIKICKEYSTALRIGTNHGSLSDRIMSHYGDTPRGMVESAMEFIRICEAEHYYNLVISMKASNPQVMIQAYRLLVQTMHSEGMNYPLHLGVTEAGDGEDGRIKSALGIGTLLAEGLGDTIRVSLTEEPEHEIPVAKILANRYPHHLSNNLEAKKAARPPLSLDLTSYQRRPTHEVAAFIGANNIPRVVVDLSQPSLQDPRILQEVGYLYQPSIDKYTLTDQAVDLVYFADHIPSFTLPGNLKCLYNYPTWKYLQPTANAHPLYTWETYRTASQRDPALNALIVHPGDLSTELFDHLSTDKTLVLILDMDHLEGLAHQRNYLSQLMHKHMQVPIILKKSYSSTTAKGLISNRLNNNDEWTNSVPLYAATDLGAPLIDGFGDGLWIDATQVPLKTLVATAFSILQATRLRMSKTEYIACPSCGRTQFDLQETTQMIRKHTDHLKGLKIGVMGCIVNGPGEMADADYGYVGTGPGRITLYRNKTIVRKNIATKDALNELLQLIHEDGRWVDPPKYLNNPIIDDKL